MIFHPVQWPQLHSQAQMTAYLHWHLIYTDLREQFSCIRLYDVSHFNRLFKKVCGVRLKFSVHQNSNIVQVLYG
jgi:hypothetical protein